MSGLARSFYERDPLLVAPALLGRTLVHESPDGVVAGRIVEVEAYCGFRDPASHAYRGETRRNAVMFGPGGYLYVYFTYGMHYCANAVCETPGHPGAVLLRAVEPVAGQQLMAARRGVSAPRLLARGPARLAQAFGLDLSHNGVDLVSGAVRIEGEARLAGPVATSPRVGISRAAEEPWRYYEVGPWASPPGRSRVAGRG
ncbi:MAG TPA: DNA-3-methyladenine glycosylase, partial [Actinomycetota bacterium]|nr:DNA-3-methyladenine glycosylase [Actinomycetota bacterium]